MMHCQPGRHICHLAGALLTLVCLVVATGCLGTLRHDALAEEIVAAPAATLDLPERDSRTYWLLRGNEGWEGSHETRYGGDPGDEGVATVRVARFRDAREAERAFVRLSPAYLYAALRDRMASEPRPFSYPEPLPGDQVSVYLYGVRLPPPYSFETQLLGQLTAIRIGRVVVVIESIGVQPERLVPAIRTLAAVSTADG